MPVKRFTKDFLDKTCNEHNITLLRDYTEHELHAQIFIDFICIKCNENTSKRFEYIIKHKPLCHNCSYSDKGNKARNTMMLKYGVKNISQLEEIKNKKKETTLKNYGVENVTKSKEVKEKIKKTNLERYGYEYGLQSEEVKEKRRISNLEKYGVENATKSKEVKEKIKKTNLERYGYEYGLQSEEVKEKRRISNLEKYGVEHPQQCEEIMEKTFKKAYKVKTFKFKSGKEIICQGYEPFALEELIKNNIDESDIITGCKNVPSIWYNDEINKKHRHYVDIFIPSLNKCIEVKSTWTIKNKKANIFNKQKAAKELGYEYEIWVYDNKGNKVETFI